MSNPIKRDMNSNMVEQLVSVKKNVVVKTMSAFPGIDFTLSNVGVSKNLFNPKAQKNSPAIIVKDV